MHDYQQLQVWRAARRLARDIYGVAKFLPRAERFGLMSQMQRSSVSIAANIAEGAARGSPADFRRFLRIAAGSASELETELLVVFDTGLLDGAILEPLLDRTDHIRRMLINLERAT